MTVTDNSGSHRDNEGVLVRAAIVVAVLLLTAGGGCGPTARTLAKSGDDVAKLGKAATLSDDLTRAAAAARASTQVDNGLAAAANSIPVEGSSDEVARVRDALKTIAWQAFCDVIEGDLTADAESIASWISDNAWDFGLAFTGDAELSLAADVFEEVTSYPSPEPPTACDTVSDSGL